MSLRINPPRENGIEKPRTGLLGFLLLAWIIIITSSPEDIITWHYRMSNKINIFLLFTFLFYLELL